MNNSRCEKTAAAVAVIVSLRTGGLALVSLVMLFSLVLAPPTFGQASSASSKADTRLEAGIAKEEVDGDLQAAMTVYQQVANDTSASRAVRAKALLRLARCEEKIGQQARQVYEQIVHDYADQPAAAQARTRLAALKQQDRPTEPSGMTVRRIEQPPSGQMGSFDTDGRRAVYHDGNGTLWFSDFTTHSKRLIWKSKPGFVSAPSRDFSSVLLEIPNAGQPDKLATIKIDGSGYQEFGVIDRDNNLLDWSWDKRCALFATSHGSILTLVQVADGQQRQLTKVDPHDFIRSAHFSPDGRFVAFSAFPGTSSVFSIPVEGGKAELLREKADLIDWTRNGQFVAVMANRSGARALFLQPVANGKSKGKPIFIRFGSFDDGWATEKGDLVCSTSAAEGGASVSLSDLDASGHAGPWQRIDLRPGNDINYFPTWAPDSQRFLYMSRNDAAGQMQPSLIVHEIASGEEREIYKADALYLTCVWPADPDRLLCAEATQEKTQILSIALDSYRVERLGSLSRPAVTLQASMNGSALYLGDRQPLATRRWEIATGESKIVVSGMLAVLSDDENWLANRNFDKSTIEVRRFSEVDWNPVGTFTSIQGGVAITPDNRWILYSDDDAGKQSLFRVPIAGGRRERIGDYPGAGAGALLRISPDGRKILDSEMYMKPPEISILEHFIPQ